jgi:hypothetical protein
MRTLPFSILVALLCTGVAHAQQEAETRTPGTIHFEDGTVQRFIDVRYIEAGGDRNIGLKIPLDDEDHYVRYEQVTSFEILRYRLGGCYSRSVCLFDVDARVATTTGLDAVAHYGLVGSIEIMVIDEATGEESGLSVRFGKSAGNQRVLNIRKIDFGSN